jgi:hypothetical protein
VEVNLRVGDDYPIIGVKEADRNVGCIGIHLVEQVINKEIEELWGKRRSLKDTPRARKLVCYPPVD